MQACVISHIDVGEVSLSDTGVGQEGIDTSQVDSHTLHYLNNNNKQKRLIVMPFDYAFSGKVPLKP